MPYGPRSEVETVRQLVGEDKIDLFSLATCLLELRERIRDLEEKVRGGEG